MKKIIRKILKEDRRQMYLDKIVKVMKNDFPLFKNMELYGFTEQLSDKEMDYILSEIFGEPVFKDGQFITTYKYYQQVYYEDSYDWRKSEYDENGNEIYYEDSKGSWQKREYDDNGKLIYRESSVGDWYKYEYDENGNEIYEEHSDGYWRKWGYDNNENMIYFENSGGYWEKYEYDENGNRIYYENSDGNIYDNR